MLPKSKRLTVQDFKGLRTRISYRGMYFDMAVTKAEETKYACVVAKKRINRAVDRNTVRRKVYTLLQHINPTTPLFIIIYPTKSALTAPYPVLTEEMTKAFATL
jgi:ribonuclease P protein component